MHVLMHVLICPHECLCAVLKRRYDDPAIIAGAGTTGLEIVEQVPDLEVVVSLSPAISARICPYLCPNMCLSLCMSLYDGGASPGSRSSGLSLLPLPHSNPTA